MSIPAASMIGRNEISPCIAARASTHLNPSDTQYCIAWESEGDVYAHMYDEQGPLGSRLTISDTARSEYFPSVAAGFCEFTVAYLKAITATGPAPVHAARVLLDGTVAVTDRAVTLTNSLHQHYIRTASRPIQDTPIESNTTLITWQSAGGLVPLGPWDIRARFFEPVAPNTSFFGTACPGPAGELAQIGSADGPPIAGNPDFKVTVTDTPPSSLVALLISTNLTTTSIPGAPGCELYAGLPVLTALPTLSDAAGNSSIPLPLPCSIPSGAILAFQWVIHTPGHNAFGFISSNDMDVSWSHF